MKKTIEFPDLFFLQERAEYLQLKSCKVSKQNGIDLKLKWDNPEVEKLEWRLLCKRGNENRCYAIYFSTKEIALKIKDYIHTIKAKIQFKNIKEKMQSLAAHFRSQVASQYYQKIIQRSELSTSGSFQNDCESATIESKIIELLNNRLDCQ